MKLLPLLLLSVAVLVQPGSVFAQSKSDTKKKSATKKAKPFPPTTKKPTGKKPTTKKPVTKKPVGKKPVAKKTALVKNPAAIKTWNDLNEDRRKLGNELKELQIKFGVASRAGKSELKKEFEAKLSAWNDKLKPKMVDAAFAVLESLPENKLAMDLATRSSRYEELIKLMGKLITAGHDNPEIVRSAARSNFALNRFTAALNILDAAEAKNALQFDDLTFHKEVKKHVEYWAKEEAIREKEKNLPKDQRLPLVEMKTKKGTVVFELFENEAPNTVANFVSLIEDKFYDGLRFHRVIPKFMAQFGDPGTRTNYDPKREYGSAGPGYTIKCECFEKNARLHFRGSLSMAHTGQRDSGGAQFFITHLPTHFLNAPPAGTNSHTVFGRVYEGMDVIDKLKKDDLVESIKVISKRDHVYKPRTSRDPEPKPVKPEPKPMKKETGKTTGKTTKPKTKTTTKKTTPAKTKTTPSKTKTNPTKTTPSKKTTKPPKTKTTPTKKTTKPAKTEKKKPAPKGKAPEK